MSLFLLSSSRCRLTAKVPNVGRLTERRWAKYTRREPALVPAQPLNLWKSFAFIYGRMTWRSGLDFRRTYTSASSISLQRANTIRI